MSTFDELDRRLRETDRVFDHVYEEKKRETSDERARLEREWAEMEARERELEERSTTARRMHDNASSKLQYMRDNIEAITERDEYDLEAATTGFERVIEELRRF